jgi:hypothetical protein
VGGEPVEGDVHGRRFLNREDAKTLREREELKVIGYWGRGRFLNREDAKTLRKKGF